MTRANRPGVGGQPRLALDGLGWPLSRAGEGLEELARRARLAPGSGSSALAVPATLAGGDATELGAWVEWAGSRLGVEVEAVETTFPEVLPMVRSAGPALFCIRTDEGPRLLVVLGARLGRVELIGPDLRIRRCRAEHLRLALCRGLEAPLEREIDLLLESANVPTRRRPHARALMMEQRLATERVGQGWIVRLPASANVWTQVVHARLPHRLAGMIGVFGIVYGLEILGWGLIGKAALDGRLDLGWLAAWILLTLTLVPLQMAGHWLDGTFALDGGRLLKQRLLAGALRMELEAVKTQGVGHLLGRVMESRALESLAVNGGLAVLVAVIELGLAAWVLSAGAGGAIHVAALAVWVVVTITLSRRFVRRLLRWTLARLGMTQDLVERMVGHRTSLAQERSSRRDLAEDQDMHAYLTASRDMDRAIVPVTAIVSGGWMLVGLAGLVPAFVTGTAGSAAMAIGLGGVLLANRALGGMTRGLSAIGSATLAWAQVGPMFASAVRVEPPTTYRAPPPPPGGEDADVPTKLMDARGLAYRYTPDGEPVLRAVDLVIRRGDRILLEGASGDGKSTLASLLVGLRRPDAGLLLLDGLDRNTLGDHWHRLATSSPQFHENHVLSGTLGFNMLMGRNWPASDAELEEAAALCAELGLDELLARMPSGMMQAVGETGWQLSHGERSRLFLARALLQGAPLVVMDESFAALDPETLAKCLRCAFDRSNTLVVIAHP